MIYKNDGEKKKLGPILSMGCPLGGQIDNSLSQDILKYRI
jgi:hypothetical protein